MNTRNDSLDEPTDVFFFPLYGICCSAKAVVANRIESHVCRSKNLISVIFCEAVAIYGVIIAIILSTKMGTPEAFPQNTAANCNSLDMLKSNWPRVPNNGAGCQGTLYMKNLLFPAY